MKHIRNPVLSILQLLFVATITNAQEPVLHTVLVNDGIDILKEIKEQHKALPVIMLSSQKSYGTAAQIMQYGAVHYVVKGRAAFQEIQELVEANI